MKARIVPKKWNPKDLAAISKLPFGISPSSVEAFDNISGLEGALKYGLHNWRGVEVKASVYYSAARRHIEKFWNGEWADKNTKIPHLLSVRFCMAIIFDAFLRGNLIDDRPLPLPGFSDMIDAAEKDIKHLQNLFKSHNPIQYTIGDEQRINGSRPKIKVVKGNGIKQVPLKQVFTLKKRHT